MRVRESNEIKLASAEGWWTRQRKSLPPASVTVETALIVLGLLALLLLVPHTVNKSDGYVRYTALSDLLAHGKRDSVPFSIVGPLFATPLWLLDRVTDGGNPIWVARYNWLLLVVGISTLALLLRRHVDGKLLRTFLLLLVYASMFGDHTRWFYGEVFTALTIGVGIVAIVLSGKRGALAGWTAAILGAVNTPAAMIGFGLVALGRVLALHRLRFVIAPLVAGSFILGESWLFRGSPFANPYDGNAGVRTLMPYSGLPGFSYPAFFGLLAIFLSFGKGLIFFAPGMFLPIKSRLRDLVRSEHAKLYAVHVLWLLSVTGLVLVYCRWWAWYGGWFWGPRFFLLASIPASFAIAVRLRHRDGSLAANLLTLAALALSIWVGINGVVFDNATLDGVCKANDFAQEYVCHFIPEFSPLWRPFVVRETLSVANWLYIGLSATVFAYLAMPLAWRIGEQIRELFTYLWSTRVLNLRWYRF